MPSFSPARRHFTALALALASAMGASAFAQERERPELLVFAASSLTNVLDELSAEYRRRAGVSVKLSFAATSVLARQIEAGTRADVFVSADQEWMNYVDARKRIAPGTRRDLVGNRLVLVAPADFAGSLVITAGFPLARALGNGRLAMGDPDTVPVGKYARAALTQLEVWKDVEAKIARAENVRTALMYVARGETPFGIVYATDAAVERRVRVVGTFPADTHEPITYPAAATIDAQPAARDYLAFLGSEDAAGVWRKYGFDAPREPAAR